MWQLRYQNIKQLLNIIKNQQCLMNFWWRTWKHQDEGLFTNNEATLSSAEAFAVVNDVILIPGKEDKGRIKVKLYSGQTGKKICKLKLPTQFWKWLCIIQYTVQLKLFLFVKCIIMWLMPNDWCSVHYSHAWPQTSKITSMIFDIYFSEKFK